MKKRCLYVLLLVLLSTVISAKGTTIKGTYQKSECGDLCYMFFKTDIGLIHLYGYVEDYKNIKKGRSYLVTYEKMSPMLADVGKISVKGIVQIKPIAQKIVKNKDSKVDKPSWCKSARTYIEKNICSNPELWRLEAVLLKSYRSAKEGKSSSGQKSIRNSQRKWIKKRNRMCTGNGVDCIARYYRKRISALGEMVDLAPAPVKKGGSHIDKLKNMIYHVDGKRISLVHGKYRSSSGWTVSFNKLLSKGDLTGDGKTDYAVMLVSGGGGSGIFSDMAVVIQTKNGLRALSNAVSLGDRVQIRSTKIKNSKVMMNVIEHGPNDPMCCPSKKTTHLYKVSKQRLIKLR